LTELNDEARQTMTTRGKDLTKIFRVDEMDPEELTVLLLGEFLNTRRRSGEQEIVFFPRSGNFAVKLVYAKSGKIIRAEQGPDLTDSHALKIANHITVIVTETSRSSNFANKVLFAEMPVRGQFRYQDRFQIFPLENRLPLPPDWAHSGWPFVLQVKVPASSNFYIDTFRRNRAIQQIELLLNGLLRSRISVSGKGSKYHWVGLPSEPKLPNKSAYCAENYAAEDSVVGPFSTKFFPVEQIPTLPLDATDEYYSVIVPPARRELEAPAELESYLDWFFGIEPQDQKKFLRSCYWLQHSNFLLAYSLSGSFIALVSAIESLFDNVDETPCEKCGKSSLGLTRRFREFIDRYVKLPVELEKRRNQLYGIRSRMTHGSSLLYTDTAGFPFARTPEGMQEESDFKLLRIVVRLALVNWLEAKDLEKD
jgi:hypothetical protein